MRSRTMGKIGCYLGFAIASSSVLSAVALGAATGAGLVYGGYKLVEYVKDKMN